MLSENKLTYENYINLYIKDDWKKCNKNNLFRDYIKNESNIELRDAYLYAILYRYWGSINKYHSISKSSASIEDVYGWVVDAALYTLRKRMWENPKSSIYQDPNGPDKVMNRMIKSFRLGHYERTNTAKRKLNVTSLSIEQLQEYLNSHNESSGESNIDNFKIFPINYDKDILEVEDSTRDIIKELFNKKDFFASFMVFNIAFQDVFICNKMGQIEKLNSRKLNYYMRHIDNNICNSFSNMLDISPNKVEEAAKTCNCLSNSKVSWAIKRNLKLLKNILIKEGVYVI